MEYSQYGSSSYHRNINSMYLQNGQSKMYNQKPNTVTPTQTPVYFVPMRETKICKVCHETFRYNGKRYWGVALKYNGLIEYHIEGYAGYAGVFHDHTRPGIKYEMNTLQKIHSYLKKTMIDPESITSFLQVVASTCEWPETNGLAVPILTSDYFPKFDLEESLSKL